MCKTWFCLLIGSAATTVVAQETFSQIAADKSEFRGPQSAVIIRDNDEVHTPAVGAAASLKQGTAAQPPSSSANRWRYRNVDGQWWYYQPNNRWLYWNGSAWQAFSGRENGGPLRGSESEFGPQSQQTMGLREPLTIQREKNDARISTAATPTLRPPKTIQNQKNEARTRYVEPSNIRPPLTIQHEKNDARAR